MSPYVQLVVTFSVVIIALIFLFDMQSTRRHSDHLLLLGQLLFVVIAAMGLALVVKHQLWP